MPRSLSTGPYLDRPKQPRHPPIVLSTPWRARVSCGVGAKNPSRRPGAAGAGGPIQSIMDELDRSSAARSPRGHDDAVKVVVRVRPLLAHESSGSVARVDKRLQTVTISDVDNDVPTFNRQRSVAVHTFAFDHAYDAGSTQAEVYETTAQPVVESCLQGYNATMFAYGQTGTGKLTQWTALRPVIRLHVASSHGRSNIFRHVAGHAQKNVRFSRVRLASRSTRRSFRIFWRPHAA